ncbi:probable tyrosyl-DNA phosphodiesterase isoform X2 [Euwallacea similis]|uniref:probable tyrosyl-DNA phosphodiesterase isoform X2 n=1 Tax=Euwallacea similis TaxID=1736056 RepID=UPI0034506F19
MAAITTLEKFEKTKPYNLFFNIIEKIPETVNQVNAIRFKAYVVDVEWLTSQYEQMGLSFPQITILTQKIRSQLNEARYPDVKLLQIPTTTEFHKHHSKLGIFVYDDESLRVVVSTANLNRKEWNKSNQGLWISPRLPKLPMNNKFETENPLKRPKIHDENNANIPGESVTGFKSDLLQYLKSYRTSIIEPAALEELTSWIKYVENADFSEVRVAFIYSALGQHERYSNGTHLGGMEKMLSQHCNIPSSENGVPWEIITQTSSVGAIGTGLSGWMESCFLRSMTSQNEPEGQTSRGSLNIKCIFPSERNVEHGICGRNGAGGLFYVENNPPMWFKQYLFHWKADQKHRTRAMPHIKTYCRISPELDKIGYYLLTSANLGPGAWGMRHFTIKDYNAISYEVGCSCRNFLI